MKARSSDAVKMVQPAFGQCQYRNYHELLKFALNAVQDTLPHNANKPGCVEKEGRPV